MLNMAMYNWCSGPHSLAIPSFRSSPSTWTRSLASSSHTVNARMPPCRAAHTHKSHYGHHIDDNFSLNHLFLRSFHSMFRDLHSGASFLLEQHQELKYLEFPSIRSATTMALFTIAMVMVLIIILATIDSGLGYFISRLFSRIA